MRTHAVFVAILSAAIWFSLAHTRLELADATPESAPTATVEILAEIGASDDDDNVALYRIILPPGASVAEHTHADAAIWYIDAGTLTYTAAEGVTWGRCGGGCLREGTPTATASAGEALPIGASVTLEAGDVVVFHADTSHAYRNDGDAPVVILVSSTAGASTHERCGGGCL